MLKFFLISIAKRKEYTCIQGMGFYVMHCFDCNLQCIKSFTTEMISNQTLTTYNAVDHKTV